MKKILAFFIHCFVKRCSFFC